MLFSRNDKIVFIGDSITDCERARPVGEGLFRAWGTGYVADVGALLGAMYPELGLRVVNMGISGNQIRDLRQRWQTDVLDLKPDWVSVMIGINDVWRRFDCPAETERHVPLDEYEATYRELVAETLPHVKGMVMMTPFYIEPNKQDAMRAAMDEFSAVVEKVAAEFGQTFVDVQAAWDALLAHYYPASIAWDRVHPNQIGSMYLARTFLRAVGFDR